MKYNGRYYIGGVRTNGDFYVSKDLAHWEGPFHAVSMDNEWATPYGIGDEQIHANDLHYLNGVFHLYWSVNHWSEARNVVHIAHAVADHPLGPYREPDKSQWLDNRIDAHLFRDNDGKLFFYMVKFTDGNTIWVRPMQTPDTFEGEAQYVFASQQGSWETLDNRVAEGPWVIRYRDRYYLMYNTNHTSTQWGNYMLGVAEASSPLGFNHGNKYPYPVVQSNQIAMEEKYVNLLDSHTQKVGTVWKSDTCRLYKPFVYDKAKNGNLSLRIHHSGAAKVHLNGTPVYESDKADYRHVDLQAYKNILTNGKNSLSVEASKGRRSGFIDLALFDMKDQEADDILYTPGQPNILRGPNGFEWWLIYMANKNGEPRGQFIDRVHFWGNKLTVDGLTGKKTPGYHPLPSQPTYRYLSDNNQAPPVVNRTIPSIPASHYYFEAGLKTTSAGDGIIAWQADENNRLTITLDAENRKWRYTLTHNEQTETRSFPLPPDFKAGVYHNIAVFKNHSSFNVLIDDIPAPQNPTIETGFTSKGLPGICSDRPDAEFDGIAYTIGWDEYGDRICGWKNSPDRRELRTKGDLMEDYELNVQVNVPTDDRKSSVYPVYIDKDNYLRTDFDIAGRRFSVSGKNKGKTIAGRDFDLSAWQDHYVNNVYSDFMERHFIFDDTVTLDAVLLPKKAVFRSDTLIENIEEKYDLFYRGDGKLQAVTNPQKTDWAHPDFVRIEFLPVKTNELVFLGKSSSDVSLQKIRVHEQVKQNYNLRVVKEAEKVRIFVDGKPVCEITERFGASHIGLSSVKADYITLFHKGK
jgi:GH43 family beta-xylosidase